MMLLTTKLHAPPDYAPLLPRVRLTTHLDSALTVPLTVISAPAGSGKTTLLSAWQRTQVARGIRVAWVSLERADDDPLRFWRYIFTALHQAAPEIGESALLSLQSLQPMPIEAILTTVLNAIAALPQPLICVIDDFHHITHPTIHLGVEHLIAHAPPACHLVIVIRVALPWQIATWRARGQLCEIDAAELAFTVEEATTFFDMSAPGALNNADVSMLQARTAGWAAGLRLAAIALPPASTREPGMVAEWVRHFDGTHRYIADYLMEEVIRRQPDEIAETLSLIAVLDRFDAALVTAVTGQPDGQRLLNAVERANLFLIPLDDQRQWYRFHPIFAEFLRHHFAQTRPAALLIAHRHASTWYTAHGQSEAAVEHALAGGDFTVAANAIQAEAKTLLARNEMVTLLRWLALLPAEIVDERPQLRLIAAWALCLSGQLEAADGQLQAARVAVAREAANVIAPIPGEMAAPGAILAW